MKVFGWGWTTTSRGGDIGVRPSSDFLQVTLSESHNPPFQASVSSWVK